MINFPKKEAVEELRDNIEINGHNLQRIGENEQMKSIKFVGVHIDEKLSWKYHLESVTKKISSGLLCLAQCKKILPTPVKIMIYNALVRPYLEYGINLWGTVRASRKVNITTIQKKAVRAIADARYNAHSTPLFSKLGILKIDDLYQVNACKMVEGAIKRQLPTEISEMFYLVKPAKETRLNARPHVTTINKEGPLAEMAKAWNKEERKMVGASVGTYTRALIRDYMWQYCNFECKSRYCYICTR